MIPSKIVPILASTANSAINRALKCGAPALGLHVPTKETEFVAAVFTWGAARHCEGLAAGVECTRSLGGICGRILPRVTDGNFQWTFHK